MQSNMFELLSHSPCSQRKRQVQSNYQNFRILKSEFLEPPYSKSLGSAISPITAAAAATRGEAKQVRAPGP